VGGTSARVLVAHTPPLRWPPPDAEAVQALADATSSIEAVLLASGWKSLPPGEAAWWALRFAWVPAAVSPAVADSLACTSGVLGRTGLEISEVGYGAWGIGKSQWIGAQDDESLRALRRAIELGLNFIDTALAYGEGHSEQLVGQVVRDSPETIYVATKVPPKNLVWPAQAGTPVEDTFPGDHVRRCAERSLRNLGTDTIDLLQLHVWDDGWADQGDWLETLHALRDEGKIRFFGISINDHEPYNGLRLVRGGVIDTVQVIYNAFDQSPEDELLPACATSDVGVIARVPFDEGGLTGSITPDTTFPEDDFRATYFKGDRKREVYERVRALCADLELPESEIAEVALRYVLSSPSVSTVIPGMRSVRNVERNMAAADGEGLGIVPVEKVRRHRWVRNFYR
jgi:aryl-alcohol dehydrogenase-like predicted oxidoreductase